jgi:hypothetical protein
MPFQAFRTHHFRSDSAQHNTLRQMMDGWVAEDEVSSLISTLSFQYTCSNSKFLSKHQPAPAPHSDWNDERYRMSVRRPLGPSYDEEAYWDAKFKDSQDAFEWLGSGQILLDTFRRTYSPEIIAQKTPRVLQLGSGISNLSIDLADEIIKNIGSISAEDESFSSRLSAILNVDFSQQALSIGKEQAESSGLQGMQYLRVDLRSWREIVSSTSLCSEKLDFIFDKSTSDAISTNRDVDLSSMQDFDEATCPLLLSSKLNVMSLKSVDPLDLVALHLAALGGASCTWAVLSYSSSRFDFLNSPNSLSRSYWSIVQKQPIAAPSGSDNLSAPPVYHWFYLLRRVSIQD